MTKVETNAGSAVAGLEAGSVVAGLISMSDITDVNDSARADGLALIYDSDAGKHVYIKLLDSAEVLAISSNFDSASILAIPALWDSADTTGVIDSAYIQLRDTPQDFAYKSLTGAWDSATTTGIIDSAYIQLRDTPQNFAYSSLTGAWDSATTTGIVDSAYIQLRDTPQNFAYSALTNPAVFADSAYVTTQINLLIGGAPSILDTLDEIAAALNNDDSAYGSLVTLIGTKTGYDSGDTVHLVDSAYVNLRATNQDFTYGSITGTPNTLDSATILAIPTLWDSSYTSNMVDSAYILLRNPVQDFAYSSLTGAWDSATTTSIIDSAYVQLRDTPQNFAYGSLTGKPTLWDSAATTSIIDSAYIQLRDTPQNFAYGSLTGAWDSATTTSIIDSAYVQLRDTPQNFAYGSLTGTPNVMDSATILAIPALWDSANTTGVIDSAYIQLRDTPQNFNYSALTSPALFADSAYVTAQINLLIGGAPSTLNTLDEIAAALNNDDSAYGTLITLIGTKTSYDSGDTVHLVDSAYVNLRATNQNFAYGSLTGTPNVMDSATILAIPALWDSAVTVNLVDSAYVQLRDTPQNFAYSAITGIPNTLDSATILAIPALWDSAFTSGMVDSAYVNLRATNQNFAYGSLTGAPNVMDSATILAIPALWDSADTTGVIDSAYVQLKAPSAYVRSAVEAATNSNVFNDSDHTKLDGIAASSNNYVHPNHSGDVVSTADGATVIQVDAVDIAMLSATGTASSTTFLRGDNTWVVPTDTDTTYSVGDGGLTTNDFTNADHTKLNAIEASADVTDATNVVAALTAGTGITIAGDGTIAAGPLAVTTVQTAASQAAQLALTAQEGDVVIRSDENKSYIHNSGSAGTMDDYTLLATPTDAVLSVNGVTGAVTAAHIATAVEAASGSNTFTDADHTKLDAIEASADVTDATNVTAAGAAMLTGTQTIGGAKTFSSNAVFSGDVMTGVTSSPTAGEAGTYLNAGGYTYSSRAGTTKAPHFLISNNNGACGNIASNGTGEFLISSGTGQVTALTLDNSQDATFAGEITQTGDNLYIGGAGSALRDGTTGIAIGGSAPAISFQPDSGQSALIYNTGDKLKFYEATTSNNIIFELDLTTDAATFAGNVESSGELTVTGAVTLPIAGEAKLGGSSTNGLVIAGKGSSLDFLLANSSGSSVISVPTGTTNTTFAGDVTVAKNAGGILTLKSTDSSLGLDQLIGELDFYKSDGSGSGAGVIASINVNSSDVSGVGSYMQFNTGNNGGAEALALTLDNLQNATFAGAITVDDTTNSTSKVTGSIQTDGGIGCADALYVGTNIHIPDGGSWPGTLSEGALYHTATDGIIIGGEGSNTDFNIVNKNGQSVIINPTGTQNATFAGDANVGGVASAGSDSGVIVYTAGKILTSQATAATTPHMEFYNSNGLVGTIKTSGTSTQFNTSSDPRLKSEFTPFDTTEAWTAFDGIYAASGKFHFLADDTEEVWGFNAHKLVDLGIGLGSEGTGSRDAAIGDLHETITVSEAVDAIDEVKDADGNVTTEAVAAQDAVTEDVFVSPAGVDQSKIVPHLLAVIKDLNDRLKVLESA